MVAHTGLQVRCIAGEEELVHACCMAQFGQALLELKVGTPIHDARVLGDDDRSWRNRTRAWLKGILERELAAEDESKKTPQGDKQASIDLLHELRQQTDDTSRGGGSSSAEWPCSTVFIIRVGPGGPAQQ